MRAVDAIDLHVPGGEFFSLLGPSGCGKTTTLRMIAGFERPTSGQIVLDGTDVAYTPPHQRNVNTVFQNYALFPHLNVYDNIAFGLKRAKRPKAEIRERVGKALELVQLSGLRAAEVLAALGRPAAARCARPRIDPEPGRAAARRAARRTRRKAPQDTADRAQGAAAGGRHHVPLRHARPGGGADDVRPARRHERRQGRAGRQRPATSTRIPRRSSSQTSSASRTSWPRASSAPRRARARSRSTATSSRRAEPTSTSPARRRSSSGPSASSSRSTARSPGRTESREWSSASSTSARRSR